ncbi:hypothetical protein EEAAV_14380 [Rahnella aceris]
MRWTSARTAIVAGFLITGLGCLMNIHLNPDAAYNVTVPSLFVRGIGQSLVVVALGVMPIQGLEKDQAGSASGLFSMVRNIGGAIGIALSSQIVVEREKLHAQRIGELVTSFAQATQERLVENSQQALTRSSRSRYRSVWRGGGKIAPAGFGVD